MSLNTISEVTILIWPVLVLVAILSPILVPDRLTQGKLFAGWESTFLGAAFFWFIPVYFVLSVPFEGDIDKVPFWASVGHVLKDAQAHLSTPWVLVFATGYAVAGLAWAVLHFWLYARRLGQQYVLERDTWMREHNLKSLEGLTAEERLWFDSVLANVQMSMIYSGDFPLRPLQQKRFFAANLLMWPLTLFAYLLGDLVLDVARHLVFVARNWLYRYWEKGMIPYFADEAYCRAKLAALAEQVEAPDQEVPA